MKRFATGIACLLVVSFNAQAQQQDGGVEIKSQFQESIRRKIEGFGLNCPIPYRLTCINWYLAL
jgi:hypothetical protein